MEVVKALHTCASICTMFPSLMGFLKLKLSTEAVMLGRLQCLPAAIPDAISIQYMSLPPIKLPKVLVSFGRTSSFITIKLSLAFFASIVDCIYVKGNKANAYLFKMGKLDNNLLQCL